MLIICTSCSIVFEQKHKNAKYCSIPCSQKKTGNALKQISLDRHHIMFEKYKLSPICCKKCGVVFEYKDRKKLFCNNSCSTQFHNKLRNTQSIETRIKRAKCLKDRYAALYKEELHAMPVIVGEYSKVYCNICVKTNLKFYSKSYKKYHPSIYHDQEHYRYLCRFNFSISQFPIWFNGKIIEEHGWYSLENLNGVSRDHRISITDGWRNNIDPKFISHPANCVLLPHKQNQSKGFKSCISIQDLMEDIERFNKLYPPYDQILS
jgi:hypothetical protein